jgi:hypothetical protein
MHARINHLNTWRKKYLGMRQNMPVYDDKATKKANKEKSRCRGLSVFSASLFSSKRNLLESAYPLFPDFQRLMNARGVETAHEQMILQCCHPSSIPVGAKTNFKNPMLGCGDITEAFGFFVF